MRLAFTAVLAIAAAPALAQAGNDPDRAATPQTSRTGPSVELTSSAQYEEGEFGTDTTVQRFTSNAGLNATAGGFRFSASVPYLRVDSPGNVIPGGGLFGLPIIIDPTRPDTRKRREGIGDVKLGAAYTLPLTGIDLTFSGQVKLPTASQREGLGTGTTDYSVAAELSKQIGPVIPFGAIGYTVAGDPDGYELRNSLSARAGAALAVARGARAYVSYGYAQSATPLVGDEKQIGTGLNANLSRRLSLGVHGSKGLSDGSPDFSAGVQLGLRIR